MIVLLIAAAAAAQPVVTFHDVDVAQAAAPVLCFLDHEAAKREAIRERMTLPQQFILWSLCRSYEEGRRQGVADVQRKLAEVSR